MSAWVSSGPTKTKTGTVHSLSSSPSKKVPDERRKRPPGWPVLFSDCTTSGCAQSQRPMSLKPSRSQRRGRLVACHNHLTTSPTQNPARPRRGMKRASPGRTPAGTLISPPLAGSVHAQPPPMRDCSGLARGSSPITRNRRQPPQPTKCHSVKTADAR